MNEIDAGSDHIAALFSPTHRRSIHEHDDALILHDMTVSMKHEEGRYYWLETFCLTAEQLFSSNANCL